MLNNAFTVAIGGLDTAENEPPKVHKSPKNIHSNHRSNMNGIEIMNCIELNGVEQK